MPTPFFNDGIAATVVDLPSQNGRIFGLKLVNTTNATAYLQIFNLPAAKVVLGTTVAAWTIRLAASESIVWPMPENPAEVGGVPLPSVVNTKGYGLSMAGTTTPTGNTGAAISVSALVQ